jgi:hypothetical protein
MVQARDGYTLTIRPIYADANRVVLDAHMTLSPGAPRFWVRPEDAHLTNADGQELPWFEQFEYINIRNNRINFEGRIDPLHFGLTFNAAAHPLPTNLALHLALHVRGAAGDSKAPHFQAGPYQFDFTMPTEPGMRAAYIHQMVESPNTSKSAFQQVPSQKIQLMLEGIIVTCAEAQFFLRSATPDTLLLDTRPSVELEIGNWSAVSVQQAIFADRIGDTLTMNVFGMPRDQAGAWTLSVPNLYGATQSGGRVLPQMFQGPWVFRFALAAASRAQANYWPGLTPATPTR